MGITIQDINSLRQQTGAGMMDCKKALTEANGSLEDAITFLRKKGQKVSEQRAGRETTEGAVIAKTNATGTEGVIISLGCETDFVAKNADYVAFANKLAEIALTVNSLEELMNADIDGVTVSEKINDQVARIGEKLDLKSFEKVTGNAIVPYIHAGNKIGVLVALNQGITDAISAIGKDVAMQVAAMNPVAVNEESVSADIVAKEREIAIEQAKQEGKPDAIVEKIADGRVKKFYKENTLVHQTFVKDGKKTVQEVLGEVSNDLTVVDFKRITL